MFRRHIRFTVAALFVLGLGSFFIFRSNPPLEVVTTYKAVELSPTTASKADVSEMPSSDMSCCESGNDLVDVSTATSEESTEGASSSSVGTPDVAPTQIHSVPLSEDTVVPDSVVQEADRFREWEEKNSVLRSKWKDHNKSGAELARDSKHQLVKMLMMLPIETRKQITEKMKSQIMSSRFPEAWDQYEADLYSMGLDFSTVVSRDASATRFKESLESITEGAERRSEHGKETRELLQEQSELDELTRDF